MENEFAKVMSERTDSDLIKIVTADRAKYNPAAITAAETELEKRNIDKSEFEKVKDEATVERTKMLGVEEITVGSFSRFLNFIIDILILLVLTYLLSLFVDLFIQTSDQDLLQLYGYLFMFGSFFAYYAVMEIMYQKTLGKFITKTKVVKVDGSRPETSDIIGRTFCRFIPFDRISFLFTKTGIHDYLSKTRVVKDISVKNANSNTV
ncbi:MAG TPA: RDD family protein [Gillisia sp.]|nr:RDD family protein [Gillisia sp.]